MFVIFDLDGTLADASHRMHLIEGNIVHWNEFYRRSVDDSPIKPNITVMESLLARGHVIEIWTGRSDYVLRATMRWMDLHQVPQVPLRMRPHGNHKNDAILKREWLYERLAMGKCRPDLVFEDRDRVVQMWREEGIICHQVANGNF